jgi:hypothetical protein
MIHECVSEEDIETRGSIPDAPRTVGKQAARELDKALTQNYSFYQVAGNL